MLTEKQKDIAEKNIRLAYFTANRYKNIKMEYEEIISLAMLGLTKAAEKWEEERGITFSTFAMKVMKNEILQELRKMKRKTEEVSLECKVKEAEGVTILDTLETKENGYEEIEAAMVVREQMKKLTETEQKLIILKTQNPGIRQQELGEIMKLSQPQISRIQKRIRKKIGQI